MNKYFVAALLVAMMATVSLNGCGTKKASSGAEAIEISETMETTNKKVDFLIVQAKEFYKSNDYNDATTVLNHVLTKLDTESEKAKDLLAKMKKDTEDSIKETANDLKNKYDNWKK
ncbi:MAG: hypothetical protein P9M13_00520 [Candidatus Ancaeobacter aquaticus]|nr:hypothetical protein [Candidatus Ancaeobacter aquaticus]